MRTEPWDALHLLRAFVSEVERRAEEKMLKTHKLEGAHYAAMKQVMSEWCPPNGAPCDADEPHQTLKSKQS